MGNDGTRLMAGALIPGCWMLVAGFCPGATESPTTRKDSAGTMLAQWFAEGSAAGNTGDFYDNRDRGHSRLDLRRYPQLQPVPYTAEETTAGRNYAAPARIQSFPTLGNASLAGPARLAGSLPRIMMLTPGGMEFLAAQYTSNQLYCYPEHQDHDPGFNGDPGFGDLFPTNTPFTVISQGSSGTDQPFLNALTMTMASFQPEVKREIIRRHLLAPTLQYLLRRSNRTVTSREDYLSGMAHPAVFRGEWLDEASMMRRAHDMTLETLPPLVFLEVLEETVPREVPSEILSKDGLVIARIFRGLAESREMEVKVSRVIATPGQPLRFHWCLLRGDPSRVLIEPAADGLQAHIRVRHHPDLLPVPGSPDTLSSRVDIGVFADNGSTFSPPSFITFYMLPNELRTYSRSGGRLLQIDYQSPGRTTGIPPRGDLRWVGLLERLWNREAAGRSGDWPTELLWTRLSSAEQGAIVALSSRLRPVIATWHREADERKRLQDARHRESSAADKALKQALVSGDPGTIRRAKNHQADVRARGKSTATAIAAVEKAQARAADTFEETLGATVIDGRDVFSILKCLLDGLIGDADFFLRNQNLIEDLAKASPGKRAAGRIRQATDRLIAIGVLEKSPQGKLRLPGPPGEDAQEAARAHLEILNRVVLTEVFYPEVMDYTLSDQFVDPRLTKPEACRDVFQYGPGSDEPLGRTRYQNGIATRLSAH